MDMVTQVQIFDKAVCISYSMNTFGKGIQTIQFSMITQFDCQKTFLFQAIQFSINIDFVYTLLKQFYIKQFSLS